MKRLPHHNIFERQTAFERADGRMKGRKHGRKEEGSRERKKGAEAFTSGEGKNCAKNQMIIRTRRCNAMIVVV